MLLGVFPRMSVRPKNSVCVYKYMNLLFELFKYAGSTYMKRFYTLRIQFPIKISSTIRTSTVPSGKLNLFWTTDVNSLMRRPFSPRTFCVLVAIIMISVRVGVTLTSTPLYPSSANSRVKNSLSSALNTPSATNWRHFFIRIKQLQML